MVGSTDGLLAIPLQSEASNVMQPCGMPAQPDVLVKDTMTIASFHPVLDDNALALYLMQQFLDCH